VLGSENEAGLYGGACSGDGEHRGGVPDDTGRRRVRRRIVWIDGFARGRGHDVLGQRDRHPHLPQDWHLRAVAGVKRRAAGGIVSNPERTAGRRKRDTPRILQDRVDDRVHAFDGDIGDENVHLIAIWLLLPVGVIGAYDCGGDDRDGDDGGGNEQ